jgi:uncharacterized protein YecA (UPF0149 family)
MTAKKSTTKTPATQTTEDEHDKHEEAHVHGPNCNHGHDALKPIVRASTKIGRNDPCSCGSNKKYKKCCGG